MGASKADFSALDRAINGGARAWSPEQQAVARRLFDEVRHQLARIKALVAALPASDVAALTTGAKEVEGRYKEVQKVILERLVLCTEGGGGGGANAPGKPRTSRCSSKMALRVAKVVPHLDRPVLGQIGQPLL